MNYFCVCFGGKGYGYPLTELIGVDDGGSEIGSIIGFLYGI